jgi:hypothetical protein
MAQLEFHTFGKKQIIKLLAFVVLAFSTLNIFAQSLPDFSGVWVQDINKSDDFYKKYDVKCTITQTPQLFKIITAFSDKASGEELAIRESSFSLDGKVVVTEEGRAKKSATWSTDKKILTTTDTKDYGGDTVGVTASYTLSGDGLFLTVKTSDINPLVPSITQVFNKKQ